MSILKNLLLYVVVLLLFSVVIGCSGSVGRTEFAQNKAKDSGKPLNVSTFKDAVGEDKYLTLVQGIGQGELDRLSYGVGQSNIIDLLNRVSSATKFIELLTGEDAMSVQDILSMLNTIDLMVEKFDTNSKDTIGKLAKLIDGSLNMGAIKYLVKEVVANNKGLDPEDKMNKFERLATLIAYVNEDSGTMALLLDNVADTDKGKNVFKKIINKTDDLKNLADILNVIYNPLSLTEIMKEVTLPPSFFTENFEATVDTNNNVIAPSLNQFTQTGSLSWGITNPIFGLSKNGESAMYISAENQNNKTGKITTENVSVGENGRISFSRIASFDSSDKFNFYIDGSLIEAFSGVTGSTDPAKPKWEEVTYPVDAGDHTFSWEYVKDGATSSGFDTVAIDNIEVRSKNGTAALVSTLNNADNPVKLAEIINGLDSDGITSNDDNFDSGDFTGQNWARTSNCSEQWEIFQVDGWNKPAVIGLSGIPSKKGNIMSLELAQKFQGDNNSVTFDYRTIDIAGKGVFKLYVDDVLKWQQTANKVNWEVDEVVGNIPSGIHTFRWEFEKLNDEAGAHLMLENVRFTGNRGATVIPAQKVAIMLNQLNLASESTVAEIVNKLSASPNSTAGFSNLTAIFNRTVFPDSADLTKTPRIIELVNNMNNVDTLAGFLLTLNVDAANQVADLMDMTQDISKVYGLVNQLNDEVGHEGEKMSQILNGVTPAGTAALIKTLDGMLLSDMLKIVNSVQTTYMADMFNGIRLEGSSISTLDGDSSPTAAERVVEVINRVKASSSLGIETHMVRLINDLASGVGASNVGRMISGLDNSSGGIDKMVTVMEDLSGQNDNKYTDPLGTGTSDHFGRLTTFINDLSGNEEGFSPADVVAQMINGIDNTKVSTMSDLILNIHRIRYVSDMINKLKNVDLLVNIVNGTDTIAAVEYNNLLTFCNEVGSSTRKGNNLTGKAVGDMTIIAEVVNELGWFNGQPRTPDEQARVNRMMNEVNSCGIQSAYDLSFPGSHLMLEPCSSDDDSIDGMKRLSQFMLGMADAKPVSIIIGDVSNPTKTIKMLNGIRDIQKMIDFINYMPGEATAKFLNTCDESVIYTSSLYLMNRLSAKGLANIIHYGTGIGDGTGRSGAVRWFTGFGPKRMAKLMNTEKGSTLKEILDKFGLRTGTAALVCGFGTTNTGSPQYMKNQNGGSSIPFYRTETLDIADDPFRGDYEHTYEANASYCQDFYPEEISSWLIDNSRVDNVIWNGHKFSWALSKVEAGMVATWDIIKGEGFLATLMDLGNIDIPYPPENKGNWGYNSWPDGKLDPSKHRPVQYGDLDPATQYDDID